jgi:hypothetical protein
MKLLELLRKGFGFVLLSMGVSRPAPKPRPAVGPAQAGENEKSLRG